jgi:L-amino acid N-acyltransferase YncA
MQHLIAYAEKEGLRELVGDVLASNERMLDMCRALGFKISTDPEDASIRKVTLTLPARLAEMTSSAPASSAAASGQARDARSDRDRGP